jgi:hypothetical protein
MKKAVILIVVLMSGFLAMGQTSTKINKRQKNQTKRIVQGVNSGELTKKETKYLVKQQKQIQHQKRVAKSDGKIGRRERAQIKSSQLNANANIYRKKHNNRNRLN